MKQKLKYRKLTIVVDVPYKIRKGICAVCNRSVANKEIKVTQLHHWKYAYGNKRVKQNPLLALDNTIELCYPDHTRADAIRELLRFKDGENIARILELMPPYQRDRFEQIIIHLYDEILI